MNWQVDFMEWMKERGHLSGLYGSDEQVLARAVKHLYDQIDWLHKRVVVLESDVHELEKNP
jgi:hypothetical protein